MYFLHDIYDLLNGGFNFYKCVKHVSVLFPCGSRQRAGESVGFSLTVHKRCCHGPTRLPISSSLRSVVKFCISFSV